MSDKFLKEITGIIQNRNKVDQEVLKGHNISIGLRDDQGAGIIVGATTKGCVIGYEKKFLATIKGDKTEKCKNQVVVNPEEIYEKVHMSKPDKLQLENFIPKLKTILPYEFQAVEGKLYYCGIDIRKIIKAHKNSFGFEEVVYLLLTGELPTKKQFDEFSEYLKSRRSLPVVFRERLLHHFTSNDMMNILQTAVDNLYELDPNPNSSTVEDVTRQSIELIAKFPSLVAYAYHGMKHRYDGKDLNIILPSDKFSYAEDFMRLFKAGRPFTREEAKILDLFLILHAEHGGGNNSTFTVRVVSSSETDTYSAISSGLASLKGHLHGGANEQVMQMMKYIKENVKDWKNKEEVLNYLCMLIRKEAGDKSGKLYGMGHAVYTKSDPRAIILKEVARKLAKDKKRSDEFELLDLVSQLAPVAFAKEKGSKKIISPNVDFYSGFVLDCLGIPSELFTPLFAMARVAGWLAHRLEQLVQNRIIRPAYFDIVKEREYIPIEKR